MDLKLEFKPLWRVLHETQDVDIIRANSILGTRLLVPKEELPEIGRDVIFQTRDSQIFPGYTKRNENNKSDEMPEGDLWFMNGDKNNENINIEPLIETDGLDIDKIILSDETSFIKIQKNLLLNGNKTQIKDIILDTQKEKNEFISIDGLEIKKVIYKEGSNYKTQIFRPGVHYTHVLYWSYIDWNSLIDFTEGILWGSGAGKTIEKSL